MAPRSLWNGTLTFGLVNVPVKVYSATEDHDVALHQVHDADGGRIRYQRRSRAARRHSSEPPPGPAISTRSTARPRPATASRSSA